MLTITAIEKNSIGKELKLKTGDEIIAFNKTEPFDVLDYVYYDGQQSFSFTVRRKNKILEFDVEKDDSETLGLSFGAEAELNPYKCHNKCVFCFVDQLPKGMRDTLYVKDDDYRLSPICGNYVTLTNVGDKELQRIIDYRLMPLYISVHTTNPALREKMLSNRFAGDILTKIERLYRENIKMHAQIVLCEGINDKKELEKTVNDLFAFHPVLGTVAVVPVGLTCHRDGLSPLNKISKETAKEAVDFCEAFNKEKGLAQGFVFCSDELYIIAEKKLPNYSHYGDFEQIENGVGLVSKFVQEFNDEARDNPKEFSDDTTVFVTGTSFAPFLKDMLKSVSSKHEVLAVENKYFGKSVTVAGLLTATDIIEALKDKKYDRIVLPKNVLKEFGDVFLDDVRLSDFESRVNGKVILSENDGASLYRLL